MGTRTKDEVVAKFLLRTAEKEQRAGQSTAKKLHGQAAVSWLFSDEGDGIINQSGYEICFGYDISRMAHRCPSDGLPGQDRIDTTVPTRRST